MYVCPRNKEVWFSFVDPNVEQSDGCGQTEARKWNKVWIFSMNNWRVDSDYFSAVDEVAADASPKTEEPPTPKELPGTVLIKFDCEI